MDKDIIRKKIYSKIDELPTLSGTVTHLLNLLEDKNSNALLLTEVIKKDPALTAKILKVANSAYYGFSQKISDLERAVALLGFNMVKSLAISIGVMKNLPSQKKSSGFSEKELWRHSVTVAILLREIGKRLYPHEDTEYLFILGLLHDIGIVVFNQFFSDLYNEVLDDAGLLDRKEIYMVEQKIIGVDHGEVGGMLLTRWNFPSIISLPVNNHHQEEVSDFSRETGLLKLADISSHHNADDDESLDILVEKVNPIFTTLDIDPGFIFEVIKFKQSGKEEIDAFFNAVS